MAQDLTIEERIAAMRERFPDATAPYQAPLTSEIRARARALRERAAGVGLDLPEISFGTDAEQSAGGRERVVKGVASSAATGVLGAPGAISDTSSHAKRWWMRFMERHVTGPILNPGIDKQYADMVKRGDATQEEVDAFRLASAAQGEKILDESKGKLFGEGAPGRKALDAAQDYVDEKLALSEEALAFSDPTFWNTDIPQGVGSMIPALVVGAATRSPLATFSTFGIQGATNMQQDAASAGGTPGQQVAAYFTGGAIGLTEALPVARLMGRLSKMGGKSSLGKGVAAVVAGMAEEGTQEFLQTELELNFSQHIIQYADKKSAAENFYEAAHAGLVGLTLGGLFTGAGIGVNKALGREPSGPDGAESDALFAALDEKAREGAFSSSTRSILKRAYEGSTTEQIQARLERLAARQKFAKEMGANIYEEQVWMEFEQAAEVLLERGKANAEFAKKASPQELENFQGAIDRAQDVDAQPGRAYEPEEAAQALIDENANDLRREAEAAREAGTEDAAVELEARAEQVAAATVRPLGQIEDPEGELEADEQALVDLVARIQERSPDTPIPAIQLVDGGAKLGKQGGLIGGQIVLDSQRLGETLKAVLIHEVNHLNAPVGSATYKATLDLAREHFPELLLAKVRRYEQDYRNTTGEQLFPNDVGAVREAKILDEALSKGAEDFAGLVEMILTDPEFLTKLKNPSILQSIRDWVVAVLNKVTGKQFKRSKGTLAGTVDRLVAMELQEGATPQEIAAFAEAIVEAMRAPSRAELSKAAEEITVQEIIAPKFDTQEDLDLALADSVNVSELEAEVSEDKSGKAFQKDPKGPRKEVEGTTTSAKTVEASGSPLTPAQEKRAKKKRERARNKADAARAEGDEAAAVETEKKASKPPRPAQTRSPRGMSAMEAAMEAGDVDDWRFSIAPGKVLTQEDIEDEVEADSGTVIGIEIDPGPLGPIETDKEARFSVAPVRRGRVPVVDFDDIRRHSPFVYASDRTRVGTYRGLDPKSGIKIPLQGGPSYPFIQGNKGKAGWAFLGKEMQADFQKHVNAGSGIGVIMLYAPGNVRANLTFHSAYMAETRLAIENGTLNERRFLKEVNSLRRAALARTKTDDNGVKKKVIGASTSWRPLWARSWKSLEDFDTAMREATFEARGGMIYGWDKKNKKGNFGAKLGRDQLVGVGHHAKKVSAGFPNIAKMVALFEDPVYADAEYGDLVGAVQFEQGEDAITDAAGAGVREHGSYPRVTRGNGIGHFAKPIPLLTVVKQTRKDKFAEIRSSDLKRRVIPAEANFSVAPREDSPAFKKWFRDSKVVDADGKPLVVYHGTSSEVDGPFAFRDDLIGGAHDDGFYGRGFYFAISAGEAQFYGRNVLDVYLSIQRPLELTNETGELTSLGHFLDWYPKLKGIGATTPLLDASHEDVTRLMRLVDEKAEVYRLRSGEDLGWSAQVEMAGRAVGAGTNWGRPFDSREAALESLRHEVVREHGREADNFEVPASLSDYIRVGLPGGSLEVRNRAEAAGFDGIHYGDEWIAFSPTQIKSATGNNGEFDPQNPDIRFSVAPRFSKKLKAASNGEEVLPPATVRGKGWEVEITFTRFGADRDTAGISWAARFVSGAELFDPGTPEWHEDDPTVLGSGSLGLSEDGGSLKAFGAWIESAYQGMGIYTAVQDALLSEGDITSDDTRSEEAESFYHSRGAEYDADSDTFTRSRYSVAPDTRIATAFSGGGTVEAALGGTSVFAAEFEPAKARAFNQAHGTSHKPRDVWELSPQEIKDSNPDIFHASPVCKNCSKAKRMATIDEGDLKSGKKIAEIIREARPPVVTIENVPNYQGTIPHGDIVKALEDAGYTYEELIVDSADYGAAQTRKRLLIRAVLEKELPALPEKTGGSDWFEMLEDLLSSAESSQVPQWETGRIAAMVKRGTLDPSLPIITMGGSVGKSVASARNSGGPAPTMVASTASVPRIIMPDGRHLRVTPRMMVRLMGLPDGMPLPRKRLLAKEILGNGVHGDITRNFIAPLLPQEVAETRFSVAPKTPKGRVPELTEAARAIAAGEGVTREQFRKLIDEYKPVQPYTTVPKPATDDDMKRALGKKADKIGAGDAVAEGARVGLRLDIPAYTRHGVWVPTIHAEKGGKVLAHASVASVGNVNFRMSERAAMKIAAGGSKFPFATIRGDWLPRSVEETVALAKEALSSSDWIQVGMDPERHAYFYDRNTHELVESAEEVIQVGPLVLAKNPVLGDLDSVRFSVAPKEDGFPVAMAHAGKAKARRFWEKHLRSRGDLPESAFEAMLKRDGRVAVIQQEIRETHQDFMRAVKEAWGVTTLTVMQERAVDRAFRDAAEVARLPKALRAPVRRMRAHVKAMSMEMIRIGAVEGEMVATVMANLEVYANRSYRAHSDPKWADNVPKEIVNNAKAFMRQRARALEVPAGISRTDLQALAKRHGVAANLSSEEITAQLSVPRMTEDQIQGEIKAILIGAQKSQSPMAMFAKGKLGSKDMSMFIRRKKIAPEIRALLGEYTEPMVNYSKSVSKMGFIIANHEFLKSVRQAGLEEGFFADPKDGPTSENFLEIAAEESSTMAPLNGLLTSPEILEAFENINKTDPAPWYMRHWMKANGASKVAMTALSVQTHARNVLGGYGFMVAQGHFMPSGVADAFSGFGVSVGFNKNPEAREWFKKALEYGVVHESANAGETFDIVKDALGKDPREILDAQLSRNPIKKAADAVLKTYQSEDDFWKLMAWGLEMKRYKEVYPEWTEEQHMAHAAKIVRSTNPTYSLIPNAAKMMRRFPVVGSFISFPSEVIRITWNTGHLIQEERANPRTRKIGNRRLMGAMTAALLPTAAGIASAMLMGYSDEEEEALRELAPEWAKNSDWFFLNRDENGVPRYINMGYTDPFSYMKGPVRALLQGESIAGAVGDAVSQFAEPFVGEEILFGTVREIMSNKTRTGGTVYNEAKPKWQQGAQMGEYLWIKAFEPRTITSLKRIEKAATGKVSSWEQGYNLNDEVIAMIAGQRRSSVDPEMALKFRARDFKTDTANAVKILSTVAARGGYIEEDDIREAYEGMEAARRKVFDDLSRAVSAARILGTSEDVIESRLKGSGVSKDAAASLLSGEYEPYSPTGQFLRAYEKGATEERVAELEKRRNFVRGLAEETQ